MKITDFKIDKKGEKAKATAKVIWEDSEHSMQEIYFETTEPFSSELICNPDAFIVACFIPAMHHGEKRISVDAEICPVLNDGLSLVMNWFQNWFESDRAIVRIEARKRKNAKFSNKRRNSAVFLSGGIDSLATLRYNHLNFPEDHPWYIRDGIFIQGQNIESDNRPETYHDALSALSEVCLDAGVSLVPIVTNIRELETDTQFFLKQFQGAILAAVAHALTGRISIAHISASESIPSVLKFQKVKHFQPYGSHPLIDPNYASSDLLIRHAGAELTRLDKTRLVADWDASLQNIKVCPANWPGVNCGRCEKCIRTMLALIALDRLDKTQAFSDNDLSESVVSDVRIEKQRTKDSYTVEYDYLELIPPLLEKGRCDLVRAINHIITVSRYQDPTLLKERLKEIDRKFLGSAISKCKNLSR